MSNGEDLVIRLRGYARGRAGTAVAVSSAWLAQELEADPRTIAAALRPYGVRPAEVERGVRGYLIADLAGLEVGSEPSPARPVSPSPGGSGGAPAVALQTAEAPPSAAGLANAQPGASTDRCRRCEGTQVESLTWMGGNRWRPNPCQTCSTAVERLSAGAGHDMTPALRAAGLL